MVTAKKRDWIPPTPISGPFVYQYATEEEERMYAKLQAEEAAREERWRKERRFMV